MDFLRELLQFFIKFSSRLFLKFLELSFGFSVGKFVIFRVLEGEEFNERFKIEGKQIDEELFSEIWLCDMTRNFKGFEKKWPKNSKITEKKFFLEFQF